MSSCWSLAGFIEDLDEWIERDDPNQDLRNTVTAWVVGRSENPYQGARREREFPNLWYATVPNSHHGNGMAVLCSYWISERDHEITCESIATLGLPH